MNGKRALLVLLSVALAVGLANFLAVSEYSTTILGKGGYSMLGSYSYFADNGTVYSLSPDRFPVCALLEFIKQPSVYETAFALGYKDCNQIYKDWYFAQGLDTNYTRVVVGFPNMTYFIYKATPVKQLSSLPHGLTQQDLFCNKTNHNYLTEDPDEIAYACSFDKNLNYTISELNV